MPTYKALPSKEKERKKISRQYVKQYIALLICIVYDICTKNQLAYQHNHFLPKKCERK